METHYKIQNILTLSRVEDLVVKAARDLVVGVVKSPLSSHSHCSMGNVEQDLKSYVITNLTTFKQLQGVLNSADNSENETYASQANCPNGMTLQEYIEIAGIRSGGKLQFLNLVRALHTGMDFTRPHTLDLLVQTLWQVGPLCEKEENSKLVLPNSFFFFNID